jgi:uncharacterized membrane protein YfcA
LLSLFALAVLSGATATVAGFGIGSVLTPFLAVRLGTPLAVAAVALPHALAAMLRLALLWKEVDWAVLKRFGLASAAGSLVGALLQPVFGMRGLTVALGALLILTAVVTLSGWLEAREFPRGAAYGLGSVSGLFGGLVGNQGGVRSGALLAFDLSPRAFVATGTAAAVLVDLARTPVYLARVGSELGPLLPTIGVMAVGVLLGTVVGERFLRGLPKQTFRKVVAGAVGVVGVWLIVSEM